MIKILKRLFREYTYFRYNFLAYHLMRVKDSEGRKLIDNNKEFENIHVGKRCFILGNGPSIKDVDLTMLANEYVFTVNQASRMPNFNQLKTNYHFWADPLFFKKVESSGDKELLNVMKSVNSDTNIPVVFFPLEQRSFVFQHNLSDTLDVRFFKTGIQMYDGYNHHIRYDKLGPSFCTVVQWCITMAIYMGFKEIYLLGCDNTSLMVHMKSALKQNDDADYAYHVTENEKRRMENLLSVSSLEVYTQSYLNNLREYRYLYEYCCKHGISLINCSSTTVIDSIPRKNLDAVINS